MRDPIAYTYEADTHCPACAVARFGKEPRDGGGYYPWPPEDARDGEGNPVGAIAPWDDTCEGGEDADRTWHPHPMDDTREIAFCTLACGSCGAIIDTHMHEREA